MRWLACVNLTDGEAEHVMRGAAALADRVADLTVDVLYVEEEESDAASRVAHLLTLLPERIRGSVLVTVGRPAEQIALRAAPYDALVLAGRRRGALDRLFLGSVAASVTRLAPIPVLVIPGKEPSQPAEGGRRVLFGVDLRAEDAGTGLSAAAAWAQQFGATLDLVHIDQQRAHVPYVLDEDIRQELNEGWTILRDRDLATLRQMMATVPAAVQGFVRVDEGDPADMLCELARDYDVLAVATHGRTGLTLWMVGSIAEKVLPRCERPVVLLRAKP